MHRLAAPSHSVFHRATGAVAGADLRRRLLMRIYAEAARISLAWTHRGFGAGCRALAPLAPEEPLDVVLNEDAVFRFPFGDGYWSTILDRSYVYERDIDMLLRAVADVDYALLDCGANYGYWSVLASSAPYGRHMAYAVEPCAATFAGLRANAALNGGRFAALHRAVGAAAGRAVLSGRKHEALSITGTGAGEEVEVSPIDAIVAEFGLASKPLVLKLDVEGVELESIAGAARTLAGDCLLIFEDHGNDPSHAVSRHVMATTPMRLYCHDPRERRYVPVRDVARLDAIKTASNRGYNVVATASPFWEACIPT